jgi:hypothetical protein
MMKSIVNLAGSDVAVKLVSIPIPEPAAHQVLIKVVVSGCNPKDWKYPEWAADYDGPAGTTMARVKAGINQGDDIAGVVEKVGEDVLEFKVCHSSFGILEQIAHGQNRPESESQLSTKWALLEARMRSMHSHGTGQHFTFPFLLPSKVSEKLGLCGS